MQFLSWSFPAYTFVFDTLYAEIHQVTTGGITVPCNLGMQSLMVKTA